MSYTPPAIPAPNITANPDLATLLQAVQDNVARNINCHAVGTIQSFKQSTGPDGNPNGFYVVTAKINYSRTYFVQTDLNSAQTAKNVDYPLLVDCPAIILGGGSTYLQFPISPGDQCLILFNDRDLNNLFAGAKSGPVASARTHSLADGIALVGFSHVPSFDMSHALLSNGNAQVGVPASSGGAQVRIANNSNTLGNLLITLTTDLINAFGPLGTTPNNPAVLALTTFLTSITSLLE